MDRRRFLLAAGSAVALSGCVSRRFSVGEKLRTDVSGEWPTFGYDYQNRKHAPVENGADASVRWVADLGATTESQAVVHDDRVYVTRGTALVAVDARTGSEVWRFEGDQELSTTPTVHDGAVYVHGRDGLYSVGIDGSENWFLGLDDVTQSCPVVTGDHVYVATRYPDFAVVDRSEGRILRKTGAKNGDGGEVDLGDTRASSVALDDRNVYAGQGGLGVVAWDRESLELDVDGLGGIVPNSPVLGDADGTYVYCCGSEDHVFKFRRRTGTLEWKVRVGRDENQPEVDFSPALADATLYVGGYDGVYAIDAVTGNTAWKHPTPPDTYSPVSVDDGSVYCASYSTGRGRSPSRAFALDRETGARQWEVSLDSDAVARPTVVDGAAFVECASGTLYGIELANSGA